jgi:hypothetical protein
MSTWSQRRDSSVALKAAIVSQVILLSDLLPLQVLRRPLTGARCSFFSYKSRTLLKWWRPLVCRLSVVAVSTYSRMMSEISLHVLSTTERLADIGQIAPVLDTMLAAGVALQSCQV